MEWCKQLLIMQEIYCININGLIFQEINIKINNFIKLEY